MKEHMSAGYFRALDCQELTDRYAAPKRICRLVNVDDLEALDQLCLQGRQRVQEQLIGSPDVLCGELIRDLTICLGDIILRYVRAEWAIGVEELGENEYSDPTWVLILNGDTDYRSLSVEHYVTHRFFGRSALHFANIVEQVVTMAKNVPGLYIGGYGTAAS